MLQLILLVQLLFNAVAFGQTTAAFTANTLSGCKPLNVVFNNASLNATSYAWDFGNGNTSNQASPSNIYINSGVYTVTLTVNGPGGSSTSNTTVTVVNSPVAGFTANQTTACQKYGSINFINSSTGYDSCVWDFGDGATSTLSNPVHSYPLAGVFSVSLIVYNTSYNCSDGKTMNQFIQIIPVPIVDITTNDSITCDQNHLFSFSANSGSISQYAWSFGDGTGSSLANPSHTYLDSGLFNIQLVATNSGGCTDTVLKNNFISVKYNPVPVITPIKTQGCAPLINIFTVNPNNVSSCIWNYGDGYIDSTKTGYHTYYTAGVFNVQVTTTYNNGCTNQNNYASIYVDSVPSFTYFMSNYTGCSPLVVQFINNNSGAGYNWLWDFGDGTTSTAAVPTHTYIADGIYSISLSATNQYGCSMSYALSAKVKVTSPLAIYTADRTTGCAPLTVNFNNQSQNAVQYIWDFGDGNTSTAANPSHAYLQSGSYTVFLIAINTGGCKDTLIYNKTIDVSLTSNSFTSLPPVIACAPFTINFQDNSVSSSWLWNFGDSSTATVQNPSHTYTKPGSYTVSLVTQGLNGNCSQNISNLRNIIINGGKANFTHTESTCPPYTATFTDSSSQAASWLWSFDDGGTSTLQNPTHIFSNPGFHSVALTITTPQGCKTTTIKNYEVYFKALTARVTTFVADTTLPISVQFNSNSVNATNWFWTFGDGDSSFLENPLHVYTTAGPYTLTLTIWNDSCIRTYTYPPVTFGGGSGTPGGPPSGTTPSTPIYNCAPYEMNFKNPFLDAASSIWHFGDGQTSTQKDPSHLYTAGGDFQVKLYVVRTNGVSDSVYLPDIIHIDKFAAGFSINSWSGCGGTKIELIPNDTTATCSWDLGNNTFLSTTIGHYTYPPVNSNYLISLVATDTNGCTASASQTFYASEINPLTVSASRICAGDTLYFLNGGLNYGTYSWNFGDGNISTSANPFHVYQDSGIFQVVLTVSDSTGCSKNFTLNQQIQVFKPQAYFTIQNITSLCNYIRVDLANQSTGVDYLNWDFGNGQYSAQQQTVYYYYTPGTYYIGLTVSQSICTSTYTTSVPVIFPDLKANFTYSQTSYCTPVTQSFTDLSKDAVSWLWTFGDGLTDSVPNPVHIYNQAPGSTITLAVKDIYGCIKTISKPNISVTNASFGMDRTSGCMPLTVSFSDSSSNSLSWQWNFGDGSTSNLKNPVHQYTTKGNYTVQLIVESTFGCYDTLTLDSVIHSGSINAGFVADVTSGCAPLLVQLTDQSPTAVGWLWDFGDGSISNLRNPAHVYNSPGIFDVTLIVTDTLGCRDTVISSAPVMIYGSIPAFTIAEEEGCTPLQLIITDQSAGAVSWEWHFGNGVTDTLPNPNYIYTIPGDYTLSLQTKDSSGCVSTFAYPNTVKVHQSARASFSINDSSGCTPFLLQTINNSSNADSLLWSFGNGVFSTDSNPVYIYNQAGIYNLSLYALSKFGCNDTLLYPAPLIVNLQPTANFYTSDSAACLPFGIQFNNTSVNLLSPSFSWHFGNGDTSVIENPLVVFNTAGTFDVSLTVTNIGGCYDEISVPGLINIYDPLPPPPTQLYSVSIIDANQAEVKWKAINLNDIDYYSLYRLNTLSGLYDSIGSVLQLAQPVPNIFSSIDAGVNTGLTPLTYKILATDKCGSRVAITQLAPHTSVFVTGSNNGGNIDLNWTAYLGCNVNGYMIYRSDDNGITFNYLTQTSSNVLSFTDTTSFCPFVYYYKIKAIGICNENDANAYSNAAAIDHTAYTWEQKNSVTRATVVDNRYVLVEWGLTDIMQQTVTGYNIFRSIDNINFPLYRRVNANQNYFEDYSVDLQHSSYYYRVSAFNFCNTINPESNVGSSILLKGDFDKNGKSLLRWTQYKDWTDGVDHYVLEKLNINGIWEPIKITDPKTTETDDDSN